MNERIIVSAKALHQIAEVMRETVGTALPPPPYSDWQLGFIAGYKGAINTLGTLAENVDDFATPAPASDPAAAATKEEQMGETTIDAAHIERQRAWSEATFGPGIRLGVLDHIRKELDEVAEDPTVLEEWVDVVILALDGAWRAGHDPQAIIDGIRAKQVKNEARTWPDWRAMSPDKAIEHIEVTP